MKFKPERAVYFSGVIDTHTAMELMVSITKLYAADPKSPITMFVASSGGSVSDAFAIYDYVMRVLKPNLETVALGEVNSMAIILFMMGKRRYVGKLAIMKFHNFELFKDTGTTAESAEKTRSELSSREEEYVNLVASRSARQISESRIKSLMRKNSTIKFRQAIKLGLAHEIL